MCQYVYAGAAGGRMLGVLLEELWLLLLLLAVHVRMIWRRGGGARDVLALSGCGSVGCFVG